MTTLQSRLRLNSRIRQNPRFPLSSRIPLPYSAPTQNVRNRRIAGGVLASLVASAVVLSAWIVQGSAHAERRSSAKTLSRSLADLPRLASVTTVADVGEAINSFRLAEKLGPLVVDPILSETAQNWSSVLSAGGSVYHDPQLVAGYADGWQTLSESVAEGGTADEALATVFANRTQATEIVRTTTTGMGIGLTTKDGRAYLVVRFVG